MQIRIGPTSETSCAPRLDDIEPIPLVSSHLSADRVEERRTSILLLAKKLYASQTRPPLNWYPLLGMVPWCTPSRRD